MHHNLILFLTCILLPSLVQLQLLPDPGQPSEFLNSQDQEERETEDVYKLYEPENGAEIPEDKLIQDDGTRLRPRTDLTGDQNLNEDYRRQNLSSNDTTDRERNDINLTPEERLRRENEDNNQRLGDNRTEYQNITQQNQPLPQFGDNRTQDQNINEQYNKQNLPNNEDINLTPEERLRRENETNQRLGNNITGYQNISQQNQTVPQLGDNRTQNQDINLTPEERLRRDNEANQRLGDNKIEYQNISQQNQTLPQSADNRTQNQDINQQDNRKNLSNNEDINLTPEERLRRENEANQRLGDNMTGYQNLSQQNQTLSRPGENLTELQKVNTSNQQNILENEQGSQQNLTQNVSNDGRFDREGNDINLTPEERLRRENEANQRLGDNRTESQNISQQNETLPQLGDNRTQDQDINLTPEERLRRDNEANQRLGDNRTEYQNISQQNQTLPQSGDNRTQNQDINQQYNGQNLSSNETIDRAGNDINLTPEERLRRENEVNQRFGDNMTGYQNLSQQNQTLPQSGDNRTQNQDINQQYNGQNLSNNETTDGQRNNLPLTPEQRLPSQNETSPTVGDNTTDEEKQIQKEQGLRENLTQNIASEMLFKSGNENVALIPEERQENETLPSPTENLTESQDIDEQNRRQNLSISENNITIRPGDERLRGENQRSEPIVELTAADFDRQVLENKDRRWFIMFYSLECPVCDKALPLFEKLAESTRHKISLGKVNIQDNPDLRDRFSIESHPSFIYFHNGESRTFNGLDSWTDFANYGLEKFDEIKQSIKDKFGSDLSDISDFEDNKPESLTELTEANFNEKVINGDDDKWFIMFYSPECPRCEKAIPTFNSLADSLKDSKDVCIGRVNADENPALLTRFGINSHPTFLLFNKGEIRQFQGERTVNAWTEFINRGFRNSEILEEDQPKAIEEDTTRVNSDEAPRRRGDFIWSNGTSNDTNTTGQELVKERPPQQPINEQIGANLPNDTGNYDQMLAKNVSGKPTLPSIEGVNETLPNIGGPEKAPENEVPAPAVEEEAGALKDLNTKDFDFDENQRWFIMFYAPWCPHCKNAMPAFEQLAKSLQGEVSVGRVDCDSNPEALFKFSIQSYPTFIYFYKGESHRYDGERSVEEWTKFINQDFVRNEPEQQPAQEPETPTLIDEKTRTEPEIGITEEGGDSLIDLTEGDFDTQVYGDDKRRWFVLFYAPWCPHCQHAMPAFNDLARSLKGEVSVGRVDCMANPGICGRFSIRGFPTFLYFYKGETRQYEGERTVDAWTEFVNRGYKKEEVKTEEEPKELEKEATPTTEEPEIQVPVPEASEELVILDNANFYQKVYSGDNSRWMIMFYAPWCPHCKHAMPAFKDLAKSMSGKVNVGIVDCDANYELRNRFSIQGYPTFMYFYQGETRQYEGPRTVEGWSAFIEEESNQVGDRKGIITAAQAESDYGSNIGLIIFGSLMGLALLGVIYLVMSHRKSEESKVSHVELQQDSFSESRAYDIDRYL